ncbi:MAG: hypothetical protein QJR02_10265 [Sinobacteraceae bacterium]|nr:hypothetical protein [Nevskiaceae bacterium]
MAWIAACTLVIAIISLSSRNSNDFHPAANTPAAPAPAPAPVAASPKEVSAPATAPEKKVDPSALYVPKDAPKYARAELLSAADMAAHSGYCGGGRQVTSAAYLGKRERDPDHPNAPYFVVCALPDRVDPAASQLYFTREDIAAHRLPRLEPAVDEKTATDMCLDATRARLKYGSSADFSVSSLRVGSGGTRNQRVDFDLTALNGFGNRVPLHATCIVDPQRRVDLLIAGR